MAEPSQYYDMAYKIRHLVVIMMNLMESLDNNAENTAKETFCPK